MVSTYIHTVATIAGDLARKSPPCQADGDRNFHAALIRSTGVEGEKWEWWTVVRLCTSMDCVTIVFFEIPGTLILK